MRSAADVLEAKKIIAKHKQDVPVIAKLEKPQALDELEAILEVSDGVMVARGDLGVEMPPEKVPVIQKHVIRRKDIATMDGSQLSIMPTGFEALPAEDLKALLEYLCQPHQ